MEPNLWHLRKLSLTDLYLVLDRVQQEAAEYRRKDDLDKYHAYVKLSKTIKNKIEDLLFVSKEEYDRYTRKFGNYV